MNYYQILQVNQTATQQEIKIAYRRLAKQFHPDSQADSANHEQIILINAAYEVLGNRQTRRTYDQQLSGKFYHSFARRQQRNAAAQKYYQQSRQQQKNAECAQFRWVQAVYLPLNSLISQIVNPLEREIESLSADPFDDRLMSIFENYLQTCRSYWERAKLTLISQPNPSNYASIAANLYYCLNHISDGLEELERFTQTYDDYYLHTGKELFNIAARLNLEAEDTAGDLASR
jgi:molecular chaperone DnaJ